MRQPAHAAPFGPVLDWGDPDLVEAGAPAPSAKPSSARAAVADELGARTRTEAAVLASELLTRWGVRPLSVAARCEQSVPTTNYHEGDDMPHYLIERELPGAGALSAEELKGIAQKSNEVLAGMGGRATWVQSFVSKDAITCLYEATDPEAIREHGACGGFPVTQIREIGTVIDPSTAG